MSIQSLQQTGAAFWLLWSLLSSERPLLLSCAVRRYRASVMRDINVVLEQLRHTPPLTELNLSFSCAWRSVDSDRIGETEVIVLASAAELSRVTKLELAANRIGDRGVLALVSSPYIANLKSLGIGGTNSGGLVYSNEITDAGVQALAGCAHLANLEQLDLAFNRIGDAGARALAASPFLHRLRVLDLRDNQIGFGGANALLSSPTLAGLVSLGLSNNCLGFDREDGFDWDGTVVAETRKRTEQFERWEAQQARRPALY